VCVCVCICVDLKYLNQRKEFNLLPVH